MTTEQAKKLQESMAKEALAMLAVHGEKVDTTSYEQSIRLIGKAWGLPHECSAGCLDLIRQERAAIREAENHWEAKHVLPEAELPMNVSGTETLNNIWDLFESAVQLNDIGSRTMMLNMAHELEETHNLLDWIEKTLAEQDEWKPPAKAM